MITANMCDFTTIVPMILAIKYNPYLPRRTPALPLLAGVGGRKMAITSHLQGRLLWIRMSYGSSFVLSL